MAKHKEVSIDLPDFNEERVGDVLQLLYIQTMALITSLDYLPNAHIKIDNQPIYQNNVKSIAKQFEKILFVLAKKFDHYYTDTKGEGIIEAVNNEVEFMRLLPLIKVTDRGMIAVIISTYLKQGDDWNNIKKYILDNGK